MCRGANLGGLLLRRRRAKKGYAIFSDIKSQCTSPKDSIATYIRMKTSDRGLRVYIKLIFTGKRAKHFIPLIVKIRKIHTLRESGIVCECDLVGLINAGWVTGGAVPCTKKSGFWQSAAVVAFISELTHSITVIAGVWVRTGAGIAWATAPMKAVVTFVAAASYDKNQAYKYGSNYIL